MSAFKSSGGVFSTPIDTRTQRTYRNLSEVDKTLSSFTGNTKNFARWWVFADPTYGYRHVGVVLRDNYDGGDQTVAPRKKVHHGLDESSDGAIFDVKCNCQNEEE